MNMLLSVIRPDSPLLTKIKKYKERAFEIKNYLDQNPDEWGKFQSEFNQEINGIFRDMMLFEKENMLKGSEDKVYKFKRFFMEKLETDFSYGEYIRWSQRKPYGYAGDFKMMNDIYENAPTTKGFDRLFDNYMQMSAISVAVRNRKDDFRRFIAHFIINHKGQPLRIMNLACGPCRELEDLMRSNALDLAHVVFDCLDNDPNALGFAEQRLRDPTHFNFLKCNAVRLALKKDIESEFPSKYDLIYSTGLFDYLDRRISQRLIQNLRKLLAPRGMLIISDVRDKYNNPSLHFMQLVGEWDLIYRDDEEFRNIFLESGFLESHLQFVYEQQGIMRYIIAANSETNQTFN